MSFKIYQIKTELSPCIVDLTSQSYFYVIHLINNAISYNETQVNNSNSYDELDKPSIYKIIIDLEKPDLILSYQCQICNLKFASKPALKSHIWIVYIN